MDELKKDENPYSIEVAKRKSIWTLSINPDEGGDELAKTEYDAFDKRITRLGFTGNPYKTDSTLTGLYYIKPSGLPEPILKRISTTDSLVGSILLARQKQVSQFGRRQEDRLSLGFGIIPDKRIFDKMSKEEKEDIEKKIEKACKTIETCGKTDGYLRTEAMNFSQWLEESARSALIVGRIATEIINDDDGYFHSFRPLDAGTVFPTVKTAAANQLEDIRERSISLLQNIYGGSRSDYIDAVDGSYDWDRYEWIQLLDGKAIQCFTDDQLRCKNFYPVSDFEWFGFPVTPLDLAINEVLTHISITAHNKLFFQSGRAARGMIIIQSDDVDAQVLLQIRNEFMAAVNSVNNSHRMPVFGIGPEDKLTWQPIDNSSRDMEYQYLSDNNARAILSAFQMSPEELPGMAHLSRGTNNQSLSESNKEYLLEAHRDTGIRPLLLNLEEFVDQQILPLIDFELSKVAHFKLLGLDAKTLDQEDADETRNLSLDGSINHVRQTKQRPPIPKELAGDLPLNQAWWAVVQQMVPFGVIQEVMFGVKDASKDPSKQFYQNPFWFQYQQMLQAQKQMEAQQQQLAQAAQNPQQKTPKESN